MKELAYNFKPYDVNQLYLLPPDMRDWLPQGYLVWFMLDLVFQMDLRDFYKEYNENGEGRAAYDPRMMVALYLYAYCNKVRSSREIERLCMESVPFRVISGSKQPDHVTISRFRKNFEAQLASLMTQVINFCYRSGLLNLNMASIDGTKMKANASIFKNRTEKWIEEEISEYLREAEEMDLEEDELYGPQGRKDEFLTREERLRKLEEFKEILANERKQKLESYKEKLKERERQESTGNKKRGRKPLKAEEVEERTLEKAKINLTDPESKIMKTRACYL